MTAVIEVSELRKEYGRTVAVADVSFEVESGEIFGLLGPNGSGKTTTARAAQGIGVLLFFAFLLLGGAGPPKEVLPATLSRIADGIPLTHAAELIRGPWTGTGWDGPALLFTLGLLVVSLGLTAWQLQRQVEG